MNTIKNLALIEYFLSPNDLEKLELGAGLHKRHSRITFKILSVENNILTIRTTQDKNPGENYFDKNRLIEITKELFGRFFPDWKVNVRAFEYEQPVVSVVDTEWIQKQMQTNKIPLKQIAKDTGIDYTSLSAIVNGKKALSQSFKAMFYYYFMR